MAYITQVGTTTTSNTNLTTATLIHTQTNTTRIRKLWVNIFADQVKGNGDYIAHITIQRAGAGSFYESIKTTKAAAAGVTSVYFGSIPVTLNATDVMKVYLIGLAADNDGTADVIVDVNEEWANIDASGNVVLSGVTHTDAVIPTVTTLTNAPGDSSGVTTLLTRLSALRAGYLDNLSAGAVATAAKLLEYVKALARKDAPAASADIAGTYDNTTDSQEAIRDFVTPGSATVLNAEITELHIS